MRILVIGGAGYIGSHVNRALLDIGHKTVVYDNLSTGRRENLFPDSDFVEGDILDRPRLFETMKTGYDALIHLAASKAAGESMTDPGKYALNNISGTINILNAAIESGILRVVFSSSAAVYGEPKYVPIDEKHPNDPENFYGFTKLEIERLLGWYDKLKGLKYASLRYFNAAGYDAEGRIKGLENRPANLIPIIMEVACGLRPKLGIFGNDYETPDGTCIRDYIHVTDLADAHVRALDRVEADGKSLTVNLGTGTGLSVLQVLEASRRISGKPVPAEILARRPGDPAKLYASAATAKALLGWEAKHSDIDTIVRTTWDAYSRIHGS